jgi:energy-coupling factor transporter ATP-binding protein EcfA2
MDPEARRNMWTVIEKLSAKRCVVLVTHSMEEVEALCTRMGVMVSGRLQCIGSAQHLKSRFGMGYQVEIRTVPARVADCIALCEGTMSPLTVEEVHGGFVRLRVSNAVDLATAFSALESHKTELEIVDYSISQCTLEQVFLKFAKDQDEETGAVDGLLDNAPTSAVMTAGGPQVTEPGPEASSVEQFPQTGNDDVPDERARVEAALAGGAQIVGIENGADTDNRGGHPTVRSEVIVVQDMEDVLDVSDGAF